MLDSYSSAGPAPVRHAATLQVSLALPTYNEAENLELLVEVTLRQLPHSRRILIVDDNSPDGTGEIADRLAAENEDAAVLPRRAKRVWGPLITPDFARRWRARPRW